MLIGAHCLWPNEIFIALFAFEIWWRMVRTIYQYPEPQHTNVHVADCIWAIWHSCDRFTYDFAVQRSNYPYTIHVSLIAFNVICSNCVSFFFLFMFLFHWMERKLKCTRMHCMFNVQLYAICYMLYAVHLLRFHLSHLLFTCCKHLARNLNTNHIAKRQIMNSSYLIYDCGGSLLIVVVRQKQGSHMDNLIFAVRIRRTTPHHTNPTN